MQNSNVLEQLESSRAKFEKMAKTNINMATTSNEDDIPRMIKKVLYRTYWRVVISPTMDKLTKWKNVRSMINVCANFADFTTDIQKTIENDQLDGLRIGKDDLKRIFSPEVLGLLNSLKPIIARNSLMSEEAERAITTYQTTRARNAIFIDVMDMFTSILEEFVYYPYVNGKKLDATSDLKEFSDGITTKQQNTQNNLEKAEGRIRELSKNEEAFAKTKEDLQKTQDKLTETLKTVAEWKEVKATTEEKLNRVNQQLQQYGLTSEAQKNEIALVTKKLKTVEATLVEKNGELEELQKELSEQKKQNTDKQKTIEEMARQTQLQGNEIYKVELAELQSILQKTQDELAALKKELQKTKKNLDSRVSDLTDCQRDLTNTKADLKTAKELLEQKKDQISTLSRGSEDVGGKSEQIEKELDNAKKTISTLNKELNELKQVQQEERKSGSETKETVRELRKTSEGQSQILSESRKEQEKQGQKLSETRKEKEKLKQELPESQRKIDELEGRLLELYEVLKVREQEIQDLGNVLVVENDKDIENKRLQKELDGCRKELSECKEALKEFRGALARVESENETLKDNAKPDLQKELNELRKQFKKCEESLEALKKENQGLKEENADLTRDRDYWKQIKMTNPIQYITYPKKKYKLVKDNKRLGERNVLALCDSNMNLRLWEIVEETDPSDKTKVDQVHIDAMLEVLKMIEGTWNEQYIDRRNALRPIISTLKVEKNGYVYYELVMKAFRTAGYNGHKVFWELVMKCLNLYLQAREILKQRDARSRIICCDEKVAYTYGGGSTDVLEFFFKKKFHEPNSPYKTIPQTIEVKWFNPVQAQMSWYYEKMTTNKALDKEALQTKNLVYRVVKYLLEPAHFAKFDKKEWLAEFHIAIPSAIYFNPVTYPEFFVKVESVHDVYLESIIGFYVVKNDALDRVRDTTIYACYNLAMHRLMVKNMEDIDKETKVVLTQKSFNDFKNRYPLKERSDVWHFTNFGFNFVRISKENQSTFYDLLFDELYFKELPKPKARPAVMDLGWVVELFSELKIAYDNVSKIIPVELNPKFANICYYFWDFPSDVIADIYDFSASNEGKTLNTTVFHPAIQLLTSGRIRDLWKQVYEAEEPIRMDGIELKGLEGLIAQARVRREMVNNNLE